MNEVSTVVYVSLVYIDTRLKIKMGPDLHEIGGGCDFRSPSSSSSTTLIPDHWITSSSYSIWRRMAKRMMKFHHHSGRLLHRYILHMLPEQFTYVQHATRSREPAFLQSRVSLIQVSSSVLLRHQTSRRFVQGTSRYLPRIQCLTSPGAVMAKSWPPRGLTRLSGSGSPKRA